jgi:hypothetical protein
MFPLNGIIFPKLLSHNKGIFGVILSSIWINKKLIMKQALQADKQET